MLACVHALDEPYRSTVLLRYFEELSNAEAARLLEMNESTASTRFVRALKRIKGILDDTLGNDSLGVGPS